jgi:pseudaminic acid cytidylyltransferase
MRAIAIIPARIGSKRIKQKNILPIGGKPMISWVIHNALMSEVFEKIFVSTDSPKIASIAKKSGAEVPFLRDKNLSSDFIGTAEVIKDMISKIKINENVFVCCIYPTAILVDPKMYQSSFKFAQNNPERFTISLGQYSHPIERAIRADEDNSYVDCFPEFRETRSQDLIPKFFDAGQFYWGKVPIWSQKEKFIDRKGIVLKRYQFVDVDTEEDLILAENLLSLNNFNSNDLSF